LILISQLEQAVKLFKFIKTKIDYVFLLF